MAIFMEVNRDMTADSRLVEQELPELEPGEVLLRIDAFSLTANNVTYALTGETLKYWDFFPSAEAGWGRVPAWGFADVIESRAEGIEAGTRYYGYYPMGTHLKAKPGKANPGGFMDMSAHRSHLSPIYNHYSACAADPTWRKELENQIMLFRPLFSTSFLIDDFLADNDMFGAIQVIMSSASSKTALGSAFMVKAMKRAVSVTGLTSPGNRDFTESTGFYDQVLTYDEIEALDDRSSVFVDFAGSGTIRKAVHERLADMLTYSCAVGASHSGDFSFDEVLPGAKPVMFFAPDQARKRSAEWGGMELQIRIAKAWSRFLPETGRWIDFEYHRGGEAIRSCWDNLVAGQVSPRAGLIASLQERRD